MSDELRQAYIEQTLDRAEKFWKKTVVAGKAPYVGVSEDGEPMFGTYYAKVDGYNRPPTVMDLRDGSVHTVKKSK